MRGHRGGDLVQDPSTSMAGAMGLFVVFLFLIAGALAITFPIVSLGLFLVAGTIAIAAGLSSDFSDLAIWGFVSWILAGMSYFGHREKNRRSA